MVRSHVVVLKNLMVLESMKLKQDFYDVEDDVYDECRKFGKIK